MNDREREFFKRLSEARLTGNQARMIHGLLAGKSVRECGIPHTSAERTITELHKLGYIERLNGRWQLSADVAGMFEMTVNARRAVPTAALPTADSSPPPEKPPATTNAGPVPAPKIDKPEPVPPPPAPFLTRKGPQQQQVIARMVLAGWADTSVLTDLVLASRRGSPPPTDPALLKLLAEAEALAVQAFGS